MKWKKYSVFIKLFLVGMTATFVYRYMQSKSNRDGLIPPQLSETDRPFANGRMEFWLADAKLEAEAAIGGNSSLAVKLAKALAASLEKPGDMKIFCMVNDNRCVFLVKSPKSFDVDGLWSNVQDVTGDALGQHPTLAVGVRGDKVYRMVIVGGIEEKPILVKQGGVFTLYPYFYRAPDLK